MGGPMPCRQGWGCLGARHQGCCCLLPAGLAWQVGCRPYSMRLDRHRRTGLARLGQQHRWRSGRQDLSVVAAAACVYVWSLLLSSLFLFG